MEIQVNKNFLYDPMLVSENGTGELMEKSVEDAIWKRFHTLSKEKREILISRELPLKVRELREEEHLSEVAVGQISLCIRKVFFGELSLQDCEAKIGLVLVAEGNELRQAKGIVEFIQNEILTIKPKPRVEETVEEVKPLVTKVKTPLLQALSKYENLGNQLITRERITLRSQTETVRPSLLYWIKYYRDELGVGHHSSVERGNFLFRSENGKRLSPEERERVNLVLKSVEENVLLEIDTEQHVILFPAFVPPKPVSRPFVPPIAPQKAPFQPATNTAFQFGQSNMQGIPPKGDASVSQGGSGGALSFSSTHVFPAEKERGEAPKAAPHTHAQKSSPFHIRPVSQGEHDEE